ncbi:MAG: hypothetical protein PHR52_12895 [Fermentimonas sp.]|nr:hypothetical protein [Fermentimonas sp.]
MIQIVTILDSLYFTSMIPDIEVNCYDSLTFTLNKGADIILTEKYWANNKGRVWIRDLGKVIASDLGETPGLSAAYTLNFTDGNTSASKSFRAILGEKRIDTTTSNFTTNNFLTLLSGWKLTHAWQIEILSLYTTAAVDITLETVSKDGTRVGPTVIRNIADINQIVEIDVSPERILASPELISRYIIKAGNRMMIYYLDSDERIEEPELIFRNSFGCRESFVPKGLVERQNEYENSTGYIRDMLFRFRTKEIKKFEANTGVLSENHGQWAEDLFVSNEVFLKISSDLVPVTITDATVVRSNAPDELISFDFKYQLSRPNLYGAGKIDIKRIFDDTFDYTFH